MINKPFDTTTRQLIETDPSAWLQLAGINVGSSVRVIDSEISTAVAIVDKVIRVEAERPWLAHIEIQTGRDPDLLHRIGLYYALLNHRHRVLVRSIIVLARPSADGSDITGLIRHDDLDGTPRMTLRFDVLRIWQQPVNRILSGHLATLPLAPLADLGALSPQDVVRAMGRRIEQETTRDRERDLWLATYLLMGLRYNADEAVTLLKGVPQLRDSTTYQAILEEGRIEGHNQGLTQGLSQGRSEGRSEGQAEAGRAILLRIGTHRFGTPSDATLTRIARINDLETLARLSDRVLDATGWDDLFS